MNFSEALALLRQGYRLKRHGWDNFETERHLEIVDGEIVTKHKGEPDCEVCELDSIDLLALDWYCIE